MARFGTWAPLASNWASQAKLATPDIICVHTMVGSLASTDAMFRRNGFGGTFSHFGIGGDGSCTQWQDTAYRAAANYNGNHRIISVECADVGAPFPKWNTNDGGAVPAFTDAQCETLAQLIAAVCRAHNIPCQIIPDSKAGRRGIGWHRLGVPGYMLPGTEQWSTATGKVCPGNRRIAQIPAIVARAQKILTPSAEQDWFDMATKQELSDLLDEKLRTQVADRAISTHPDGSAGQTWWETEFEAIGHLRALASRDPEVNPVAQAVVNRKVVGDLPMWQAMQQQSALLQAVASRDAGQIAAAIPADLAKQVADLLATRLSS